MSDWIAVACNPQHSVVVEACAGSGKTWLLTSRLFRLLLAGARPDQILAITFTRKAAQEMKERLFELLRACAIGTPEHIQTILRQRGAPTDADSVDKARSLAGLVFTNARGVTIDTFHGWFASLCQMAPLASGFSRQSEPTQQTEFWMETAIQAFIRQILEKPDFFVFRAAFNTLAQLYDRQALIQLFKTALSNRVVCSLWLADGGSQRLQELFGLNACDSWPGAVLQQTPYLQDWQQAIVWLGVGSATQKENAMLIEATLSGLANGELDSEQAFSTLRGVCLTDTNAPRKNFLSLSKAQTGQLGDKAPVCLETAQRIVDATLQALSNHQDQRDLQATQALVVLLEPLFQMYAHIKAEQGLCDFDDLEATALHLLMDPEQRAYLLQKLDTRVKHLLVDEFQDTNPVQWNVLRLWLEEYGPQDRPSVFLVGDPKQSIYRFRRADARLFGHAREWLQTHFDAHCLNSDQTRRCSPVVVAAVNRVFSESVKKGLTAFRPHVSLGHTHGELSGLQLYPLSQKNDPVSECMHWVAQLQAWRSSGAIDSWASAMVLVRTHLSAAPLIAALREADIPFVLQDRGERYQSMVWRDTLALLTFLDDPHDDMALLQLLRSPLIGLSSDGFAQLMAHGARQEAQTVWHTLQSMPGWSLWCNKLRDWLKLARSMPLFETLSQVIHDTQAAQAYLDTAPARHRVMMAEHWDWLKMWALGVNKGRFPDLKQALQEARRLQLHGGSDGDGTRGNQDALRIMTVHSAKGLEADHVILLNAQASPSPGRGSSLGLSIDWPLGEVRPHAVSVCENASVNSVGRARAFAADRQAKLDEEDHLLYVALTRARQSVHVSGTVNRNSNSAWYPRLLPHAYCVHAEWPYERFVPERLGQTSTLTFEQASLWVRPQFPELTHPVLSVGQALPRQEGSATRMGIAWHATLEHIDAQRDSDFEVWWSDRQLDCETFLSVLNLQEKARVQKAAQCLFESTTLAPWLKNAPKAWNELEWVLENGQVLRADRIVVHEGRCVVLDYKWSVNDGNWAAYQAQVLAYVALVNQTLKNKNTPLDTQAALIDRHGEMHWVTSV